MKYYSVVCACVYVHSHILKTHGVGWGEPLQGYTWLTWHTWHTWLGEPEGTPGFLVTPVVLVD